MLAFEPMAKYGPEPRFTFGHAQDHSKIAVTARASASEILFQSHYLFLVFLCGRSIIHGHAGTGQP
jgi:hypothetical protein